MIQKFQEILTNSSTNRHEKISKLLDIIKRKHLLLPFYRALLISHQVPLAKVLKNEVVVYT